MHQRSHLKQKTMRQSLRAAQRNRFVVFPDRAAVAGRRREENWRVPTTAHDGWAYWMWYLVLCCENGVFGASDCFAIALNLEQIRNIDYKRNHAIP